MPTLSLITCTRNPPKPAFDRVLAGIGALQAPAGWDVEHLIIDSASFPALDPAAAPRSRIVRADVPGLALARRTGIAHARGELLVWFDDDNVPAPDYLTQVVAFAGAHPDVTVWGAGTIRVEFTGHVPEWADRTLRPFFQERTHARDDWGRATDWAPFFPVGSGLVTRRAAAERWAERTARGDWSLTGRSGAALSAGDDAQLIFGAVAAGESVGVCAAQRLVHLIPPQRCEPRYLDRMEFGISASLRIARAECFPGDASAAGTDDLSFTDAARAALSALRAHGLDGGAPHVRMELARRLGAVAGAASASRRPEPRWLRTAILVLGLR